MKRFLASIVFISILCHSVNAQTQETAQPAVAVNLDTAIKNSVEYLNGRLPAGTRAIIINIASDHANLSNYIIDEMTMALFNDGRLVMVDRQNLEAIRQELNFQFSGDVSDESMVSIGKMLGLQSIISGRISPFGSVYRLQIRAIAVETGAIQGMQSLNIAFDSTLSVLTGAKPPKPTREERRAQREERKAENMKLDGKGVFAFTLPAVAYLPVAGFNAGTNITVFERYYNKIAPSVFLTVNYMFYLDDNSDHISNFHYEAHGDPPSPHTKKDDMQILMSYLALGGGILFKYRVTDRFILNVGPSFEYFINMGSSDRRHSSDFFGMGAQGGLSYRVHPNVSLDLNGIVKFGFGSVEFKDNDDYLRDNRYEYTYTVKQPIFGGIQMGITFMFPYGGKR